MVRQKLPRFNPRATGEDGALSTLARLLRELAGLLVTLPQGEGQGPAAKTGVSVERTAQVAGLQAVLLPALTAPLFVLVPPTDPVGATGWVLATLLIGSVIAIGVRLVRPPSVSGRTLAVTNAYTAAVIGVLVWLSGGFGSPFPLLLVLVAASIAPHPAPLRRALLAWLILVALMPLVYDDPDKRDLAEVSMVAATAIATLLTMLWLSARVRRAEVGLMDAASIARRERERAEARAGRLEEIDDHRERLVSRISHELRTPLTSIRGYLEALIEGASGELGTEQRDYALVALRNTTRLERLIGDLLLLSSVEAGQVALDPQPLSAHELLRRLCEDIAPVAGERGVTLEVEPGDASLVADRDRLAQALTNLASNAIKYSPRGATVTLRARESDGEVAFEVADRGVGVPAAEIDRLGERFFRASSAGDTVGTGLGLAITRDLVELQAGRLEIESELGRGSLFRVSLPARARDSRS